MPDRLDLVHAAHELAGDAVRLYRSAIVMGEGHPARAAMLDQCRVAIALARLLDQLDETGHGPLEV